MAVVEYILFIYFAYVGIYTFIFSLSGLFYRSPVFPSNGRKNRIAVFIPAYKEDTIILSVAKQAAVHGYPNESNDVIVIADSLKPQTIEELRKIPVTVLEVSLEKSLKVHSLNKALEEFEGKYDMAVILDADNVMGERFLELVNDAFNQGFNAIQSQRTAKNKNTPFAVLDGLSEAINNHIYRKGAAALKMSVPLIGSGMAFDYNLLKECLKKINSVGEDKELELIILSRGVRILYLGEAVVYDEKVDDIKVFSKQRRRWLASQYLNLRDYFFKGWGALFSGKLSYFNGAVLRNIQFPRILNFGFLFVITAFLLLSPYSTILQYDSVIGEAVWVALFVFYAISLLMAIPRAMFNREFFRAVLLLPQTFFVMFLLLFKFKKATKTFVHTPHGEKEDHGDNGSKT